MSPISWSQHPRRLIPAIALAILSCGDPSAPTRDAARRISVNEIVAGSVTAGDSALFRVRVDAGQRFSVLVQAVAGSVTTALYDVSITDRLQEMWVAADGQPLGRHALAPTTTLEDSEYAIKVTGDGSYALQVYVASPAPDHVSRFVVPGDTIEGEDIAAEIDVDEFTLRATAGEQYIAYLMATDSLAPGHVMLTVHGGTIDPGGTFAIGGGADRELDGQRTRRFTIPTTGDYTIRVRRWSFSVAYIGPYRLLVRRVDPRPEHFPVAVPLNDTIVGESLDYVGDVDEFVITGNAGDEYNVLFLVTNGDAVNVMQLMVPHVTNGWDTLAVHARDAGGQLADLGTGRFMLPTDGRAVIRVVSPGDGMARGHYRMYARRMDRQPEHVAATLAVGDSVTGERIDHPGDFDEFVVTVPADTQASLLLELDSTSWWAANKLPALNVRLIRMGGEPLATATHYGSPTWSASTRAFEVPAGQYLLRVDATSARERSYVGGYRVILFGLSAAPEGNPSTIAIGDTIVESLDPSADTDVFTFEGQSGDDLEVRFQGMGASSSGGFSLLVGAWPGLATASTPGAAPSLDSGTGRFTLAASGQQTIRVQAMNSGAYASERGPYRLALLRVSRSPEVHLAPLALGDSVGDELLDTPGDIDEFTLRGAPGSEAVVRLTAGATTGNVAVDVLDPLTRQRVAGTRSPYATETSKRFLLPDAGELILRVLEYRHDASAPPLRTGSYGLAVVPIHREPEAIAASIALNDTVAGEAVDFHADVDEFRFSTDSVESAVLYFETPQGVWGYEGLIAELVDAETGTVLGSVTSNSPSDSLEARGTAKLALRTGPHMVRVRGVNDSYGRGNYRFTVRRAP